MINSKRENRIILVLLILIIAVNVISFFFLPDMVSLQINTSWDVHGSSISKTLFVWLGPLVLGGAYLYASRYPGFEKQGLLLATIAFIGSIATIAFNMIGA